MTLQFNVEESFHFQEEHLPQGNYRHRLPIILTSSKCKFYMQFKKSFHDIIDQPKVLGTDKDQKPLRSFWPVMTSSKSCIIAQMPKPGVLQEVIMSHRNMHINIWLIHMKDQLKISVYARNQIQVTSYNGEMTSSKMLISSKLKSSLRTRNIWYMYIIQYQIKFAVELTLKKCNLHNIEMRRWAKILSNQSI